MLFTTFWQWLSAALDAYVGQHLAALAQAIEPAAVTLASVYVMIWGFMHLKGAIEEPVVTGAVRIVRLVVVFGLGLRLWQYNEALVDTFMQAPIALAAELAGAADPVATVDALWEKGGAVAATLWEKGGVFNGDMGYYLAAVIVYLLMGAVCVYTLFLMALSRVAVALLLAVGPLFILALLFEATQRFFEHWIAQLANYALVGVLAVLTASLMLTVVESYAAQTLAKGSAIATVDALDMLLVAGIVLLILRQVLPIAARLGGGLALSSFGAGSGAASRGAQVLRAGTGLGLGLAASTLGVGAGLEAAAGAGTVLAPRVERVQPTWRSMYGEAST